jgi:translation initiation factor 1
MGGKKDEEYRVVYSTDHGSVCPACQKAKNKCSCSADRRKAVVGDGQVRVRRETKGRGGKTVTTISGLAMNREQIDGLQKELKRLCGAGGAVKDGIIEIQGDHSEAILKDLARRGISAKRAGG